MTLPLLSIRSLLLILVIATGLPLVGLLAYSVYAEAERAISQEKSNVYSLAQVFAANVSRTMATNKEALDRISKRPRVLAVDEHHCDPIFNDFRTFFPAFTNIASIDLSGRIVCSALEQPGGRLTSIAHTEWFKRATAERRFIVGNPFLGPITGRWVSVLVTPIYDDANALKGFMALPLDLAAYDPKISGASRMPATRYGIISTDGILIWRNEDPEKLIGTNVRGFEAADKMLATKDGVYEAKGAEGTARVYAVIPVPEANWYVYVGIPSRPLYVDAFQRAMRNSALALGFLLGIAGLTIYIAHRRIVLPVLALVSGAKAIKEGRYDARVKVVGSGEVAEVAAEFNQMAESWQAAERQLRELNLHLEERIHARTTELEVANREISAFSYSVSHDLRAPLRAIDGFCHMLLEDYGERLDDTARGYLSRVRKASQHMAEIIDDMLGMARSMRDEMHCRVFDFSAMARSVIADITSSSPRDGVEWKLADGIMAFGDENLLGVVLQNLLGNAYKYTSKHASASIEIGVLPEMQNGSPVYFVKDDGAGFDMGHSGKLFGLFQRLHRDDFDGHGIGLATVHRIIQRHGGKIWAESAVEQGATFYFTLSDPEKNKAEACMACVEPACDAREGDNSVSAA